MKNLVRILKSYISEEPESTESKHTTKMFFASNTHAQSAFESLNVDHGIFLTRLPSQQMVVIGPYSTSADAINVLMGCHQ